MNYHITIALCTIMYQYAIYLRSWEMRPGDQATKTNIQRLHNIMRARKIKTRNVDL